MKGIDFHRDVLPLKDKVFRLALRVVLDRQEAEDITQDTLIKIWQQRDEWHQIQNIEAYCLTIARRMALDNVRRKELKTEKEQDIVNYQLSVVNPDHAPDEILDQKQRIAIVRRLMDQLPEVQRTVMQLRDIEGLRYDEIAQITNLSETQVKVYLHRARKKIRKSL